MRKFWQVNKWIIVILIVWRALLFLVEILAPSVIPLHTGYNGPIPWANHDGMYYLRIAQYGYYHLGEAYFPGYPILIALLKIMVPLPLPQTASLLSLACFIVGIFLLFNILRRKNITQAYWAVLFLITFPTSFFYASVYPTGLFFLLMVLVYVCVQRKLWMACGAIGILASATRIVGVFLFFYVLLEYISSKPKKIMARDIIPILCMPLGLISYMVFLYIRVGDPLFFFHLQPLFGANRTTEIIFIPQILWRYGKILFTAYLQPTPVSYFITFIELSMTMFAYFAIWIGIQMKQKLSLILYSFCVITLPTLTGTFSSMPRYILNALPIFMFLGLLESRIIKMSIIVVFVILQIILSALFLQGWFVA